MAYFTYLILSFKTLFPPAKAVQAGLAILLNVCDIRKFMCRYDYDAQVNQAAKGVISSGDALVDLLESIEQFVNCLDVYSRTPLTPVIIEIVVKIMVELLATLALVTKELQQRRSSKAVLADVILCSPRHSKTWKEFFWK
jgi:hypothetical protein